MTSKGALIAEEIVQASGLRTRNLGLRFDRVVVSVLDSLTAFAKTAVPPSLIVLVTITAPIRLPSKTVIAMEQDIHALVLAGGHDCETRAMHHGNDVRIRLAERLGDQAPALIGFVHNPGTSGQQLLDLAAAWLRDGTKPRPHRASSAMGLVGTDKTPKSSS